MDRFLATWPLAVVVAVIIAVLLTEEAALLTETWKFTISEIITRRPDMALWAAFVVGFFCAAFLGHIATLIHR